LNVTTESPVITTAQRSNSTTQNSVTNTTKVPTNPEEPPFDIVCNENERYIAHPFDCTKFFHCSNGISHLQECPSGLYFNPELNVCDYPRNVDCPVA